MHSLAAILPAQNLPCVRAFLAMDDRSSGGTLSTLPPQTRTRLELRQEAARRAARDLLQFLKVLEESGKPPTIPKTSASASEENLLAQRLKRYQHDTEFLEILPAYVITLLEKEGPGRVRVEVADRAIQKLVDDFESFILSLEKNGKLLRMPMHSDKEESALAQRIKILKSNPDFRAGLSEKARCLLDNSRKGWLTAIQLNAFIDSQAEETDSFVLPGNSQQEKPLAELVYLYRFDPEFLTEIHDFSRVALGLEPQDSTWREERQKLNEARPNKAGRPTLSEEKILSVAEDFMAFTTRLKNAGKRLRMPSQTKTPDERALYGRVAYVRHYTLFLGALSPEVRDFLIQKQLKKMQRLHPQEDEHSD